jgi:tetratricopeptide (TPR) repeat protein
MVLTSISFLSSLDNGFTNWDDDSFVTGNLLIRELSWNNLRIIFTSFYKKTYSQPLVLLSFSLEYHFFQLDPFIYHLDNLIFHILNSLLVFFLIFMLSKRVSVSLVTALLFGVHPLHVESVAWISERKDMLSTFFFLQAIIFYLYYKERGRGFYCLSLFVFIFSLLSKAMVITLPFVLLLCDYLSRKDFNRKTILEKVPFFAISGIFGIINLFIHKSAGAISTTRLLTPIDNLLRACKNIIFYLTKTIFPLNLSAIYPYSEEISILMPEFLLPIILLSILGVILLYSRRYSRTVVFGVLFFLVTLLPVIKLVHFPSGGSVAADRYMYIPSIGLFYVVGLVFYEMYKWGGIYENLKRILSVLILSAVVLSFAVITYQRNMIWKDSETLWLNVIENHPDAGPAHYNLGRAYFNLGRLDEAIQEYQTTIKLYPSYAKAHSDLGLAYYNLGKLDKAITEYKEAIKLNSSDSKTFYNLGLAYYYKGLIDASIASYQNALKFASDTEDINNINSNLGNAYAKKGFYEEAIKHYQEALRIIPDDPVALNNLKVVLGLFEHYKTLEEVK